MPRISTVIAIGLACNSLAAFGRLGPIHHARTSSNYARRDGKPKGIVKQDDIHVYAREIEGQEIRVPLWPKDAPAVVQTEPRTGWVGCYMPCGLQVEGFPKPGKLHFEWYVPIDADHHSYMILHAGYARTEQRRKCSIRRPSPSRS